MFLWTGEGGNKLISQAACIPQRGLRLFAWTGFWDAIAQYRSTAQGLGTSGLASQQFFFLNLKVKINTYKTLEIQFRLKDKHFMAFEKNLFQKHKSNFKRHMIAMVPLQCIKDKIVLFTINEKTQQNEGCMLVWKYCFTNTHSLVLSFFSCRII